MKQGRRVFDTNFKLQVVQMVKEREGARLERDAGLQRNAVR